MTLLSAETRRFLGLSLSVWALAANGSTFAFSLYSAQLKERFNMNQQQLNVVVLFGMIGGNLGMPSGWLFDKIGPKCTLVASVFTLVGWLLLAMAFEEGNPWHVPNNLAAVSFYYFCITFATCFSNTGGLLGSLQNFKQDAGTIVLIAESFVGLGATIYTNYFNAFFHPNVDHFFYFSAVSNALIFILAALLIPSDHTLVSSSSSPLSSPGISGGSGVRIDNRRGSKSRFALPIGVYITTVAFVAVMVAYQVAFDHITASVCRGIGIGTSLLMCAFLVTPFFSLKKLMRKKKRSGGGHQPKKDVTAVIVAQPAEHTLLDNKADRPFILAAAPLARNNNDEEPEHEQESGHQHQPPTSPGLMDNTLPNDPTINNENLNASMASNSSSDTSSSGSDILYARSRSTIVLERVMSPLVVIESTKHQRLKVTESATLSESLKTINLWVLFYVVFVCIGITSTIIFNASQMYQALDWDNYSARTNAIFVCIIGIGSCFGRIIVGIGAEKVRHSTSLLLLSPICLACVLVALVIVPPNISLFFSFLVGAIAFGISWSSIAILSGDLFGHEHLGVHYNFVVFAPLFSAVFFNILLFSKVYDNAAHRQHTYPNCYTRSCVQETFFVMLGLDATALIGAVILHVRTKRRLEAAATNTSSTERGRYQSAFVDVDDDEEKEPDKKHNYGTV